MHAATIEAANWWARPRGATAANWIQNYQNSLQTRHRTAIAGIVTELGGTSVLEVGCHCGPNLVRIAQEISAVTSLTGIDISAEAIAAGQWWVSSLGLSDRIQMTQGRCPDKTATLDDACVDIVLSCYALAYVAPEDLDATLWEMGRLAKKAVVIAEPMAGESSGRRTLGGYQEWAHNYREASRWIGTWRGMTLGVVAVDPPVDALASILVAARA